MGDFVGALLSPFGFVHTSKIDNYDEDTQRFVHKRLAATSEEKQKLKERIMEEQFAKSEQEITTDLLKREMKHREHLYSHTTDAIRASEERIRHQLTEVHKKQLQDIKKKMDKEGDKKYEQVRQELEKQTRSAVKQKEAFDKKHNLLIERVKKQSELSRKAEEKEKALAKSLENEKQSAKAHIESERKSTEDKFKKQSEELQKKHLDEIEALKQQLQEKEEEAIHEEFPALKQITHQMVEEHVRTMEAYLKRGGTQPPATDLDKTYRENMHTMTLHKATMSRLNREITEMKTIIGLLYRQQHGSREWNTANSNLSEIINKHEKSLIQINHVGILDHHIDKLRSQQAHYSSSH